MFHVAALELFDRLPRARWKPSPVTRLLSVAAASFANGMSWGVIVFPFEHKAARCTALKSSRTFPGQEWFSILRMAADEKLLARPFAGGLMVQKVLGQQSDIFRPLPQRRQMEPQHVEAEIQIAAKLSLLNGVFDAAVLDAITRAFERVKRSAPNAR